MAQTHPFGQLGRRASLCICRLAVLIGLASRLNRLSIDARSLVRLFRTTHLIAWRRLCPPRKVCLRAEPHRCEFNRQPWVIIDRLRWRCMR